MGTLTLSGVLKRPVSGDVVPNARIIFDAIATGTVVLKGVSSSCKTAADGSYSVELEYGDYAIQVSWSGQTQQYGTVHIDDTTPIGTLNDLLLQSVVESELTPDIVLEFRQLQQEMQEDLAEMQELNGEATDSASAAAASATAAKTSETNSAASEDASAASASAAKTSETNSAASEDASAASASAAKTSETNSAASEAASAASAAAAAGSEASVEANTEAAAASAAAASTSETNAANSQKASASSAAAASTSAANAASSEDASAASEVNAETARDAAEEYAQEAKDAASKVTSPLTDQGVWAIQSGYPSTPGVASIWQVTDGGVDPVNGEIIWDPGDMLVYLATADVWCRLLGQQTVAGEPIALKFDADIILSVGAGLQIVTSGTVAVDIARLDSDNMLVVGDPSLPGVAFKASDATNMYVLVPDGSGGYTKSRIYSEAYPPVSDTYDKEEIDEKIADTLQKENNLSDLTDAGESRTNMGLGDSATKNVGTGTGTVAAGDDSRIVGAVQNTGGEIDGDLDVSGSVSTGSIEILAPYPFIDFHFEDSDADYTSRIIEEELGVLTFACSAKMINALMVKSYNTEGQSRSTDNALITAHDFNDLVAYAFGYYEGYFAVLSYNDDGGYNKIALTVDKDGNMIIHGDLYVDGDVISNYSTDETQGLTPEQKLDNEIEVVRNIVFELECKQFAGNITPVEKQYMTELVTYIGTLRDNPGQSRPQFKVSENV